MQLGNKTNNLQSGTNNIKIDNDEIKKLLLMGCALAIAGVNYAQEANCLWPGQVPLATQPKAGPVISDNDKRGVIRIAEVTDPLLKVYRPAKGKANNEKFGIILSSLKEEVKTNPEEVFKRLSEAGYTYIESIWPL